MRAKAAIAIVVLACLASVSTLYPFDRPRSSAVSLFRAGEVEVVINCTIPDLPTELNLLKIVGRNYTKEEALAIARDLFGLTGNLRIELGPWPEGIAWKIRNSSTLKDAALVVVCPTGAIEFTTPEWLGYYSPPKLPSPDEATSIADELMKKMMERGLFPSHESIEIEFIGVTQGAVRSIPAEGVTWVNYLDVRYVMEYQDIPIRGGRARIVVSIGDSGRIIAFFGLWKEVEPDRVVGLLPIEDVLERLKHEHGLRTHPAKIFVNGVRVAYWVRPFVEVSDYIFPVYEFEAVVERDTGDRFARILYLPAVEGMSLYG